MGVYVESEFHALYGGYGIMRFRGWLGALFVSFYKLTPVESIVNGSCSKKVLTIIDVFNTDLEFCIRYKDKDVKNEEDDAEEEKEQEEEEIDCFYVHEMYMSGVCNIYRYETNGLSDEALNELRSILKFRYMSDCEGRLSQAHARHIHRFINKSMNMDKEQLKSLIMYLYVEEGKFPIITDMIIELVPSLSLDEWMEFFNHIKFDSGESHRLSLKLTTVLTDTIEELLPSVFSEWDSKIQFITENSIKKVIVTYGDHVFTKNFDDILDQLKERIKNCMNSKTIKMYSHTMRMLAFEWILKINRLLCDGSIEWE